MKTVLHVLSTGEYSGAENVAITIIQNYTEDFTGIYMSLKGTIEDILDTNNIKKYCADKINIASIKQAVTILQPDILHTHDYNATFMAAMSLVEVPIISHIHNNVPWMKKISLKSFLFFSTIPRIKYICAVSESVVKECWYSDLIKRKSIIIGNPITIEKIKNKKKQDYISNLLFVGRLTEQKDPIQFLQMVCELKNDGIEFIARMLGRGELEQECKKYILDNNLSDTVIMEGFVYNPYDYMNSKGILVIPSKWEGFGLVAIEALIFGMPVVANCVGGLKNIVNLSCGICDNDYVTKLNEIKRLLIDNDYKKQKIEGAIARANELENIDEYMIRIQKLYSSITKS